MSLEMSKQMWGSLSTDFIVKLLESQAVFDFVTNWTNRFARKVRFVEGMRTDIAVNAAQLFFANISKVHGCPNSILSNLDLMFISAFKKHSVRQLVV